MYIITPERLHDVVCKPNSNIVTDATIGKLVTAKMGVPHMYGKEITRAYNAAIIDFLMGGYSVPISNLGTLSLQEKGVKMRLLIWDGTKRTPPMFRDAKLLEYLKQSAHSVKHTNLFNNEKYNIKDILDGNFQ